MRVIGISPLDKDSTVSIVEDGKILFAAGEERYSRVKQQSGFPALALADALRRTNTDPRDVAEVSYAFFDAAKEYELKSESVMSELEIARSFRHTGLQQQIREAKKRVPRQRPAVPGLSDPNVRMEKGLLKRTAYRLLGGSPWISQKLAPSQSRHTVSNTLNAHRHWQAELEQGLAQFGLQGKLKRYEHHLSHAANSYLASGFDRALILTLDGYGSGLAASVSIGEGGSIRRLHDIRFPNSLGQFYETVTSALGFRPSRHEGKIVGLASYGDPQILAGILRQRISLKDDTYRLFENLNVYFSRYLASQFPMIDVAAAYQYVLEEIVRYLTETWVAKTGCDSVVLSGGVAANVKMNQRIYEARGVRRVFIYPNMGDGGCGSGVAMLASWKTGQAEPIHDVYLGPEYREAEILQELRAANLECEKPDNLAAVVARKIHEGKVVARFGGRMEYGPRALGNRSILYHAKDPSVNQWLNKRLGRTEFMPFAPVTLWEERDRCFVNVEGAEHAAEFMTITFDCTPFMRKTAPAAVHVDGTARPQLIRHEKNPEYYQIVKEYAALSGIPTIINTSFNMHEEPIVCSPADAVRAFLLGHLDYLAIGPFLCPHPSAREDSQAGQSANLVGAAGAAGH
jgi:carbamoyltransferase